MLAAAAAELDRLVVGVDAGAAAMEEASRRAARRPGRGGLPNALFVVAAAEALPPEPCRCWCPRPTVTGRPGSSRSTWGKRLGAGTRRPAWLLEATRVPAVVS
ncbi:MAG TPA: hypothetical protein VHS79_03275 [Actinomycetes bacterium]|nr:hypothetical protein [Actinomycetes bacterium]